MFEWAAIMAKWERHRQRQQQQADSGSGGVWLQVDDGGPSARAASQRAAL